MADIPKIKSSHIQSSTSESRVFEEDERIPSEQQTLDDSDTNRSTLIEDDDLVNVDDGGVQFTFIVDRFPPLNSSVFVPPSSSSYHHDNQQVSSSSCSYRSCDSEFESVSDYPDSAVYPDCLYGHDSSVFINPFTPSCHHDDRQVSSNSSFHCSSEPESGSESVSICSDSTAHLNCLYGHDSSFFAPLSSSSYHQDDQQASSNSSSYCSSDSLYGRDEEFDQTDFITDLFDLRGETEHVSIRSSNGDVEIVSEGSTIDNHDDDSVSNNIEELGSGYVGGDGGGLRVTRIESESDTEDSFPDPHYNMNFGTDWDAPSLDFDRVDDSFRLSSVTDSIPIEDLSISSDLSSEGDAAIGVLDWEILLAVNNFERDLEIATDGVEGFVYTPEFDTLIGQFVEHVRSLRGSPPAAKSFIDNLPLVALKKVDTHEKEDDHDDDDTVTCAVCKDEVSMDEKVVQLPCKHYYHGECIVPWLSIRNTCPVCRFELPTDDVDYERSKNRVNDDELRVGYDFDLSH